MFRYPLSNIVKYAIKNPSSIREIMSIVTEYRIHPEKFPRKLLYLGGGWPQDPPPNIIRKTVLSIAENPKYFNEITRYGTTKGEPEFIQKIIEYEKYIFDRNISEEEVIVGLGSTELTAAIIKSILNKDSEVILTRPYYLNYRRQILLENGLDTRIKYWNIISNNRFNPLLDQLQDLINNSTRLIILTIPGNPDGQIFDEKTLSGIIDIAEEKSIWVLIDVAYRTFCFEKYPKYFFRSPRENEIWMCSLSKEFRIPGWRIAYIVANENLIEGLVALEQARILCPSRLVQAILAKLLEKKENLRIMKDFHKQSRLKYGRIASKTIDILKEKLPKIDIIRPMGGFYVFFNIEKYMDDSRKACNDLLNKWQVALAPGTDFGMKSYIRLSFAPVIETPEVIFEAIDRMEKYFNEMV